MDKKKIYELVEENYVFASVLYYFGIEFYDYSQETLTQVCKKHRLNLDSVVEALEAVNARGEEHDLSLIALPIELVLEYLKHTHHVFVKQRLPYIVNLINKLALPKALASIEKDLKFIFPLFVEDFIHHIYEEEDTLFHYIVQLEKAKKGILNASFLYFKMEKFSIQHFAVEHEVHEDEMEGIRRITKDYQLGVDKSLHLKVIYQELRQFETELITHAKIENEILFPKAMLLEKEVKKLIRNTIPMN